jgi:hypothetical protein
LNTLNSGNAYYHAVQIFCLPVCYQKNVKIKLYKTIVLPVVFYEYETWFLLLSQEHRLRMFENWMLRRMLGPKRDEVTARWKEIHNE